MNHDTDALRALFAELMALARDEAEYRASMSGASDHGAAQHADALADQWRQRFELLTCPNYHHGLATGIRDVSHHHHDITGSTCSHTDHSGAYGW